MAVKSVRLTDSGIFVAGFNAQSVQIKMHTEVVISMSGNARDKPLQTFVLRPKIVILWGGLLSDLLSATKYPVSFKHD